MLEVRINNGVQERPCDIDITSAKPGVYENEDYYCIKTEFGNKDYGLLVEKANPDNQYIHMLADLALRMYKPAYNVSISFVNGGLQ